jgi:glycosyltransferase involved in cell wall biosynthesis
VNIVCCTEKFWPFIGGIETTFLQRALRLMDAGHRLTVVTDLAGEDLPLHETHDGLDIHRVNMTQPFIDRQPIGVLEARSEFSRLMADVNPDVLHAAFSGPSIFYPYMHCRAGGRPFVVSIHGDWARAAVKEGSVLHRSLGAAEWVVAVSQAVLDDIRGHFGVEAARSSVVYDGLEPPEHAALPPSFEPPVLCCVGRLTPEKGFDVAVEALAVACRSAPELHLVVVGDGPERERLEALSIQLGVEKAVEFRGWQSPVAVSRTIAESSMLLAPSRTEGFGMAALEGLQAGRPVIASAVGGLPELLDDGRAGRLVPRDDPEALASTILRLLMNPSEARKLAQRAAVESRKRFSLERSAATYEALYRRLAGRNDG